VCVVVVCLLGWFSVCGCASVSVPARDCVCVCMCVCLCVCLCVCVCVFVFVCACVGLWLRLWLCSRVYMVVSVSVCMLCFVCLECGEGNRECRRDRVCVYCVPFFVSVPVSARLRAHVSLYVCVPVRDMISCFCVGL